MLSDIKNENLARQRDQFYTQLDVAKDCVQILRKEIKIDNPIYLEPSAGTGSFLLALKNEKVLAYDIDPKYPDIKLLDFLTLDEKRLKVDLLLEDLVNIVTIGNPPFGKNSSLAIKFFNHAANFSQVIAMILPATFEKESIQKRLDRSMHLVRTIKLNNDLFLFNDKLVKVPTVFQIWEKKSNKRVIDTVKKTSDYFSFVKREEANFAIQRVGGSAGKVKLSFQDVAQTSHYFIKAEQEVLDAFIKINWSTVKYNTAGNPSISKKEIIELLEKQLNL